jgi:HEAT repeat protein
MRRPLPIACCALLALTWLGPPVLCQEEGAPPSPLQALLARVPAGDAASSDELGRELAALGAPAVEEMAAMLDPADGAENLQARMALHALSLYVARPGAERQREAHARALLAALESARPAEVKAFLVRQLQLAGGPEAVAPLGDLLLVPGLAEPAAQALLALPADGVAEAFRSALPRAEGEARVTIVQALGELGDAESVPALRREATAGEPSLRLAALYALGATGDPDALALVEDALATGSRYERGRVAAFYLSGLERLAGRGHVEEAAGLCRQLAESRADDVAVRVACLTVLAETLGLDAFDDLLAAMDAEELQLRISARRLAVTMKGEAATQRWLAKLSGRPAAERAHILRILGERGDPAALPRLLQATQDADETARVAALEALGHMPEQATIPALIRALTDGSPAERTAARGSLSGIPGPAPVAALEQALQEAPPEGRREIVRALAERGPAVLPVLLESARDPDEAVRVESLRAVAGLGGRPDLPALVDVLLRARSEAERRAAGGALLAVARRVGDREARVAPLLDALEGADAASQQALLGVLGRLGGEAAYGAVTNRLGAEPLRDAAVRALCDWPDPQPSELLFGLAREAPDQTHRILAFRAHVRMIGMAEGIVPGEALRLYRRAMEAAPDPGARRLVLAGVAGVADPEALDYVQGFLNAPELRAEAEAASLRVARSLTGAYPERAVAALEGIRDASENERLRQESADALAALDEVGDYIIAWLVAGPYTAEGKKGDELFDTAFPPEDPAMGQAPWRVAAALTDVERPHVMDLEQMIGGDNRAAYLRTVVHAPAAQSALLLLGSDDGIKAWLNGEIVHENNVLRGLSADDDEVEVNLKAGANTLVLKVTENGGDWAACARLVNADQTPIEGLEVRAD